jgi:hypothetical protein
MKFDTSSFAAKSSPDDDCRSATREWIEHNAADRTCRFDKKFGESLRHRGGMSYALVLVIGLSDGHNVTWVSTT